nr:MAG TPA: hypothetical protein [Caudoviricetes sp.]DAM56683.1 MAG TPA: hypothetical protein [Caudoviricetes sp.]DAS96640.1 MAG TPA: hypothetical protein [Caudoviricetes sp.]DAX30853.1 MAG TPA: hypothetical protein [Caudoviricetes sp.]
MCFLEALNFVIFNRLRTNYTPSEQINPSFK